MCGIVGYVGDKQARDVVIEGLRRLEYRGYDSAGIALVVDGAISSNKREGKLANLEKALEESPLPASTTGIGHTRWATHGAPNDVNAHPHLGQHARVAVVHNGIIENFAVLRDELTGRGHTVTRLVRREPGAADESRWDPAAGRVDADVIAAADICLVQLEIPVDTALYALEVARHAGVRTVLNPAPAPPMPIAPHVPAVVSLIGLAVVLVVLNTVELMRVERIGWRAMLSRRDPVP